MGGKVYKIPEKTRSCVPYILNSALPKLKIPGNCTFSGGQIPMWVLFKFFEIAFFWKCFMCTFLRKVIYLVFLRFSYKTTAPKLTILTHDFLYCKGAEFGRLNWKCNGKTNLMQNWLIYHSVYIISKFKYWTTPTQEFAPLKMWNF